MPDLDTGPSSIRDDSICEPSLPPNKSSGDIVERLRARQTHFYDGGKSAISYDPEPIKLEAAADIERLRRERDEARLLVVEANNSLYGSQGYFHSTNGGPFDKYHLARPIEELKSRAREALTAESAVAAAWDCIEKLEGGHQLLLAAVKAGDPLNEIVWRIEEELRVIARASAIRSAVSKKTAESGHSPSTHNLASE